MEVIAWTKILILKKTFVIDVNNSYNHCRGEKKNLGKISKMLLIFLKLPKYSRRSLEIPKNFQSGLKGMEMTMVPEK